MSKEDSSKNIEGNVQRYKRETCEIIDKINQENENLRKQLLIKNQESQN